MDCHLVTIVVGVETVSDERMKLDSFTIDELWLESLDGETVERWGTVKEDIFAFDNFVKSIPNHGFALLNHARCGTDVVSIFILNEPRNDEWLKEFKRHLFWQTTLVNAKFWTNHDYGAARVVNALTKKVLAETTLLTLEKVRQTLELATTILRGSSAATTASIIINQSIDSFLKHAFFVAADDFWSIKVDKLLQAVVTVDYTAIKIVQI